MKRKTPFLILIGLLFFSGLFAQYPIVELYGSFSKSLNNNSEIGGGGGIAAFTGELGFGGKKHYSRRKSHSRDWLFLSAGFNGYACALGRHTVNDIPLLSPGTGNAKARLTNLSYALDGVFRVRLGHNYSTIQPFVDVFAGVRSLETNMSIIPDHYSKNNPGGDSVLYDVTGINWGLNAGFLINPDNDFIKIDVSASWSNSMVPGRLVDLSTARNIGNALDFSTKNSPYDMLQVRIGIILVLSPDPYAGSGSGSSSWHSSGHCGGHSGGSHISIHAH